MFPSQTLGGIDSLCVLHIYKHFVIYEWSHRREEVVTLFTSQPFLQGSLTHVRGVET